MKKILIVLCYSFYVIFAYATRIDVKKQKIDLLKGDSIYLNIKCNKHCDVNMYILKKRYTKKIRNIKSDSLLFAIKMDDFFCYTIKYNKDALFNLKDKNAVVIILIQDYMLFYQKFYSDQNYKDYIYDRYGPLFEVISSVPVKKSDLFNKVLFFYMGVNQYSFNSMNWFVK